MAEMVTSPSKTTTMVRDRRIMAAPRLECGWGHYPAHASRCQRRSDEIPWHLVGIRFTLMAGALIIWAVKNLVLHEHSHPPVWGPSERAMRVFECENGILSMQNEARKWPVLHPGAKRKCRPNCLS